jgi:hypothetical protein
MHQTLRAISAIAIAGSVLCVLAASAQASTIKKGAEIAQRVIPPEPISVGCYDHAAQCGFPGPTQTGANCSQLARWNPAHPPSGTYYNGSNLLEVTHPNTTISGLNFGTGVAIAIEANHTTLDNDCVTVNGSGHAGATAVAVVDGATGTRIENSTLGGANPTTGASGQAITNDQNDPDTVATGDLLENCGECVHGTWTLNKSYVTANAAIPGEHYEDWYFSDGSISADDDTFINRQDQTANIFGNTHGGYGGPADNAITLKDSLLVGGGYSIYTDASSTAVGTSSMTISGNIFGRCTSNPVYNGKTGGESCSHGTDTFGIWPQGGYFGVIYPDGAYCSAPSTVWRHNSWTDSGTVGC